MLTNWIKSVFIPAKRPDVSKNAARRLAHTSVVYEGPMRHRDGKVRFVRWLRLNMRYVDRSKYNGDGSLK